MATDLGELVEQLDMETGFEVDDQVMIRLLKGAVVSFNEIRSPIVTLTGTALDVDLTDSEKRLLVKLALVGHIRGELVKAAKNAIVFSDLVGRVQLNYVPQELRALLEITLTDMQELLKQISTAGLASEVVIKELGETLALTGTGPVFWWG